MLRHFQSPWLLDVVAEEVPSSSSSFFHVEVVGDNIEGVDVASITLEYAVKYVTPVDTLLPCVIVDIMKLWVLEPMLRI